MVQRMRRAGTSVCQLGRRRLRSRSSSARNPKVACIFSPSYVSEHTAECASLAGLELLAQDAPPVDPPFANVTFELRAGKDASCAAWGWYSDDMANSGWNYLSVVSNPSLSDAAQARAAGFVEGALTVRAIHEHKVNEFETLFLPQEPLGPDNRTQAYVDDMMAFQLANIASQGANDTYWASVGLLYQQLQGMTDGFAASNTDPSWALTFNDLLMLQLDGDLADIQAKSGSELARQSRRSAAESHGLFDSERGQSKRKLTACTTMTFVFCTD